KDAVTPGFLGLVQRLIRGPVESLQVLPVRRVFGNTGTKCDAKPGVGRAAELLLPPSLEGVGGPLDPVIAAHSPHPSQKLFPHPPPKTPPRPQGPPPSPPGNPRRSTSPSRCNTSSPAA